MANSPSVNGIYTAYLTGVAGSSFGMLDRNANRAPQCEFVLEERTTAGDPLNV